MKRVKAVKQPLVVIDTKTNQYVRYVGKTKTDHIQSDRPLDRDLVEQFRVDPTSVFDGGEDESA